MYSDFAKREKTPQEILLEEALKDAQDIPQAHTDWWELEASDEEIDAYYDLAWTAEFWLSATIPQLAVLIDTRSIDAFPDENGKTALMYACQYCPSPDVVRWYFNFQPNPHYKDKDGKTAQDYALANPVLAKCADVITALRFENLLCDSFWKTATLENVVSELRAGKDVNMHGISGETPLMLACQYCHDLRIIQLLLQAGADVNYATARGYTALMSAAEFNPDAEVIRYLVANGADVRERDMYRKTARIYLRRNKILAQNREISAFLRKLERKAWWNNFVQKIKQYLNK